MLAKAKDYFIRRDANILTKAKAENFFVTIEDNEVDSGEDELIQSIRSIEQAI
jgi:hypothetical protein